MLDPKLWNDGNLAPDADRPLMILFKGHIPSLKNDRSVGISKAGKPFSRPNDEVKKAIAAIRDVLDRQLDRRWFPMIMPQEIKMWLILGAHGVTSMPDADLDNMTQTVQEALAPPRKLAAMTQARRQRLIAADDRQFVSLHPFRRTFTDKDRIFHELYIWGSKSTDDPIKDIEEYSRVARLREEALSGNS